MPTQVDFMFRQITLTTNGYRVKQGFRVSTDSPYIINLLCFIFLCISLMFLVVLLFPGPLLLRCLVFLLLFCLLFFPLMQIPMVLSAIRVEGLGRCSQASNPASAPTQNKNNPSQLLFLHSEINPHPNTAIFLAHKKQHGEETCHRSW